MNQQESGEILHTASREIIWHLGCANCGNWWSYATMEARFMPRRMTCPHCSHNAAVTVEPVTAQKDLSHDL